MLEKTSVINQFLNEIERIIKGKDVQVTIEGKREVIQVHDGDELRSFLLIEPPFNNNKLYEKMISELRNVYPEDQEQALEDRCSKALPTASKPDRENATFMLFPKFMANYLSFIRDVDPSNLLDTYNILSELQQKANSCLTSSRGLVILPTVIEFARVFARLAIGLDKNPQLIAHLVTRTTEDGKRETLPERAANVLRNAFVTCLQDRGKADGSPSTATKDKPQGKAVGIYKLANLCLKILFQCDKQMNAEQIFTNIVNSSPPLFIYPASERVTYLYYLGRFHFSCEHYYPSQMALQAAYDQCPATSVCLGQRRLILIYLIAANMILGRFPNLEIYNRPEAAGLQERFQPIIDTLIKGDLETFRRLTHRQTPIAQWFFHYKMFLQIEQFCEVIVWRSLFRRAFLLSGVQGDTATRKASTLDLNVVLGLFIYLEKRALHPAHILSKFGPAPEAPASAYYIHPEFVGVEGRKPSVDLPTLPTIYSKCASLISQGFMNGYISDKLQRFAIKGANKDISAVAAGFPNVWMAIELNSYGDCPGWQVEWPTGRGGVVNITGARPVE